MSKTLRILHCLRAPVGGLFRHVRDLTIEQSRLGYKVGILCDSSTGGENAERQLERLQPHCQLGVARIPMSRNLGLKDFKAYLATKRFAQTANINILHGHGAKGGAFARLAAQRLKRHNRNIHVFYTPHGGSLHYDRSTLVGRLFLSLEGRIAPFTDGFIFESQYSARIYEEKLGLPPCEMRIIPNGLHAEEFFEPQPEKDAPDFLFVGELRQLKGVDLLLEALSGLNQHQNVRALIVGAGPDEARFKKQATTLELNEKLSFPGPAPANEAFSRGRCLIVPSRAESFPYIVLEAAAAQMPMIVTNVGGIPEILEGTGIKMIPPADTVALQKRMQDFLDNPLPFIQDAKTLKNRVQAQYTVEKMADSVIDFYFSKSEN